VVSPDGSGTRRLDEAAGSVNNPFVGFVPWIIFWVVSSPSTWEWATLGALVAAVILAVPSAERGDLKILDVGSIAFFAALSLLAFFLDRAGLDWVEDYSQAISSGALAAIAFGSLMFIPLPSSTRASPPRRRSGRRPDSSARIAF
jgi:hypothetical protein